MLWAAERLVEAQFTVAAINTQITSLNTALGTTATVVASRVNGLETAPKEATAFPALAYWVGAEGAASELKRFGKRDTRVAVRLAYLSRHATLADAKVEIQVALEALQTIAENLPGLQQASTQRFCVEVLDPVVEFVPFRIDDQVIRQGGELRFVMLMRTEGLT